MPAPAARSAGGALRKPYKPLAMELQYPRPMLSKKPRLPDPDAIALPPIGDDPAYQAALVELVALERRRAEIEQRRKTRQGKAARGKDGPQRAGEGARFAARRHLGAADPIDDIKAADEEEFQVLRPAIAETTRRLDDMHGDLSLAACQKVQPQYATALRAALQAMIDLNAALEAAGAVRPMLRARGYSVLDTQLPSGFAPAATALGDLAAVGASQSWFWKKMPTDHGLI